MTPKPAFQVERRVLHEPTGLMFWRLNP